MEKVAMEGFAFVDGGVCAAKGFRAGGVYCGIKENPEKKNDLMVVAADTLCNAAAVYTQNKVKGAPVLVMKKHLKATCGRAIAVGKLQERQHLQRRRRGKGRGYV